MQRTSCPRSRKLWQRWEPIKPAPPVIATLAILSSDRIVGEAQSPQFLRVVNVAAVENNRAFQQLFDGLKVRAAKLIPFDHDQERIGSFEGVVIAGMIADPVGKNLPRLFHRLGIIGLDASSRVKQGFDHDNGRRVPHIIRAGFKGKSPDGKGETGQILAEMALYLFYQHALLPLVDPIYGPEQRHLKDRPAHADHRADILGKAGAAVTYSRKDKMGADASVDRKSTRLNSSHSSISY